MEWAVVLSELLAVIRKAAKHMTGFDRRKFMATMAMEHCNGSPRQTETSLNVARSSLAMPRSLRRLINHRSFSLRKVRKTQPLKKIPETNDIFAKVKTAHLSGNGASLSPSPRSLDSDVAVHGKRTTASTNTTA